MLCSRCVSGFAAGSHGRHEAGWPFLRQMAGTPVGAARPMNSAIELFPALATQTLPEASTVTPYGEFISAPGGSRFRPLQLPDEHPARSSLKLPPPKLVVQMFPAESIFRPAGPSRAAAAGDRLAPVL